MAKGTLFDLWFWPIEAMQTAMALNETWLNAHAVIDARMPMIKTAMANPLEADIVELTRMVTEKWDAFGQSGRKLATGRKSIQTALAANARDLGRIAGGGFFGPADWQRLGERNLALWSTFATLPGAVLKPVRTRVADNARRLRSNDRK